MREMTKPRESTPARDNARRAQLARLLLSIARAPGQRGEAFSLSGVSHMIRFVSKFIRDEEGVTAMEYGMIAALIAVVILGVLGTLGTNLNTTFGTIQSAVSNANNG
jgi:pilus assembly protein Flp/PilA